MASQRSIEDLSQLSDEEIEDEDVTQMSHQVSQSLYEHDKRQVFGVSNKIAKRSEQESDLSEGQQNESEDDNYKNTISEDEIPIQSQSQQSERTWRGKNSKKRSIKQRKLSKTEEPYESEKESSDVEMIESEQMT